MDTLGQEQINVYAGRGILVESQGPTWMYGTASEHNALYQYQLSQAKDVYMGMVKTESPYYQPSPMAPVPFSTSLFPNDPTFSNCDHSLINCAVAWALRIIDSSTVYCMGLGLYSWFSNYSQTCLDTEDCQQRGAQIAQSNDTWLYSLVTKGMVEMVSPVNENGTLAANNRNGLMSSILAWVREDSGTIGARTFPGFQLYNANKLVRLTDTCKTALSQTILCDTYFLMYQHPQLAKSTGNTTFTDKICDQSCGGTLKSWFDNVASNCANQTLGNVDPTAVGGYIWQGYNETCLKDPSTGQYCTDALPDLTIVNAVKLMTPSEMCSWCWTHLIMMMQSSPYSVYNKWYQDVLILMKAKCNLNTSTAMPPSLFTTPEPEPMCVSGKKYTVQPGDTCNTIALKNNVASAAIVMGNSDLVTGCSNLTVGSVLCLPLTCRPLYTLKSDETCIIIEMTQGLRMHSLQNYNPWIRNYGCRNLQDATAHLGNVLCLGPRGGKYVPSRSRVPCSSTFSTGCTPHASPPPANATIANGTTSYCGIWHTAAQGDTCVTICIQHATPASLFLAANPALSASDCDSSLVVNTTYCVGPHSHWNDPSWWID